MKTTVRFFSGGSLDDGFDYDFNKEVLLLTKENAPIPRVGELVGIGFGQYVVTDVNYGFEERDDDVLVDLYMLETSL
ncbi:MAG: hypothetical protein WCO84_01110 [bacterium]